MTEVVLDALATARVVALLGPRQAGKSTLARMLIEGGFGAEYLTLDDAGVLAAARADPVGFIAARGRHSVIDEVQRAPELLLAIKSRVDVDGSPGQFLLTGSANLRRIPTVADALPGRVDYLPLWPLTQGEVRGRREQLVDRLFANDIPSIADAPVGRSAYADLVLAGGFPEARTRTPAGRARYFDSYVTSIVERDVADAARVHDPTSIGTLLRLVAARSGSLARYETLGREIGLDGKTVKSHIDVLERLFLIRIRRAWHANLGKRQIKAPKLYVSDTGLLSALVGANADRFAADGGLAGALLETFVTNELERQSTWSDQPPTFWHYRDGDREADLVIEHASGDIVGIEVKTGATARAEDLRGLAHLRDRVGDRFRAGVLIHTGQQTLPFGDRLWAMPLAGLWES